MSEDIEQKLLKEIAQLKKEINEIKGIDENSKPTYRYSKIRDSELEKLFDIEQQASETAFDKWFNNDIVINDSITENFISLIQDNKLLIDSYSEEDLKVNFIVPILNLVNFKSFEKKLRDFYEQSIKYETDDFILNGTTDFVVSKGLFKSERPYFFIQEFKRSEDYGNPRPQLLAELISGVELNCWNEIKGAYIIGATWHFVILKKIDTNKYEYYISNGFDSMDIEKLKAIYSNLMVVKREIINL